MGIVRVDVIDPQMLRHPNNSTEILPDEKPSVWIKRITGKKPNVRRK